MRLVGVLSMMVYTGINPMRDILLGGNQELYDGVQGTVAALGFVAISIEATYPAPRNTQEQANVGTNEETSSIARTVPAQLTREGQTPVIGKMYDLNKPGSISNGEFRVTDYLPDMGSPKANWQQNSGILRSVINEGMPIRDASLYPMSNAGFLGAERNLLIDRGWSYSNGFWYPGK